MLCYVMLYCHLGMAARPRDLLRFCALVVLSSWLHSHLISLHFSTFHSFHYVCFVCRLFLKKLTVTKLAFIPLSFLPAFCIQIIMWHYHNFSFFLESSPIYQYSFINHYYVLLLLRANKNLCNLF